MAVTWVERDALIPTVKKQLIHSKILLDIGCGIQPQQLLRPAVHICFEPFKQYVERLQELLLLESDRSFVVLNGTWDDAVHVFPEKSVDTVILNDVIEHLEKDEAVRLLRDTEKVVRRQIAIFTPLGFMPQHHPDGKDAWGLNGAHWQEHRSGWQPEDFDDTWNIFAVEKFHYKDNLGNDLQSPFGAMWAIKTFPEAKAVQMRLTHTQRIYKFVDKLISLGWMAKDVLKGRVIQKR